MIVITAPSGGGGPHPDLETHDEMGLATDDAVDILAAALIAEQNARMAADNLRALLTDPRFTDQRVPTDNSVSTAKLQNGAVTAAKVAADVATQQELDDHAATPHAGDHPDTDHANLVTTNTAQTVNGAKTIQASATGVTPVVAKAFSAGQTADLQQWQRSNGSVVARVDPDGTVEVGTLVAGGIAHDAVVPGLYLQLLGGEVAFIDSGSAVLSVTDDRNVEINTSAVGAGEGVIGIGNATTVPTTNPAGGGVLYVEGGQLKYRSSGGVVTAITPAQIAAGVAFTPAGTVAATTVQAAIEEVAAESVPIVQKGAANGVATLGADSKIPSAQIPALALSEFLGTVGHQAAMLALTGERGDWCIRSDFPNARAFILETDDPTQVANWTDITTAGAVVSVNGQTGQVELAFAPLNASYVTLSSSGALTNEKILGDTVIMRGDMASMPVPNASGRLYVSTDDETTYIDTAVDWVPMATTPAAVTQAISDYDAAIYPVVEAKAEAADLIALKAQAVTAVIYTDPDTARPTGWGGVVWIGPSTPTNAEPSDLYVEYTAAAGEISGAQATESDTGQAGALISSGIGGQQATETDTGVAGTLISSGIGGGQATETDTGQAGSLVSDSPTTIPGQQATEADTGVGGALISSGIGGAQAVEADSGVAGALVGSASGNSYQLETTTDRYLLEDSSGVYLMEV